MPRSRGGAGPARAPSRPSAPPARAPAPTQQQQRPMSTAPTQAAAPPPAQAGRSPGLFGQMASTAAGVAVGSSIGHAIGGFFGGGSSQQAAPEQQQQQDYQQPVDNYSQPGQMYNANATPSASNQPEVSNQCQGDLKAFTDCMNQNYGSMTVCGWYFEQLKACQRAASQY